MRTELERASVAFERATRSRVAADHSNARVLHRSVQAIRKDPAQHGDGVGPAMLLDVALTAVAYAMHWHRTPARPAAGGQTLIHLQAAYAQIAGPVLTSLASQAPGPQTKRRYTHHLQQAVPEQAERILADSAWDTLATVLAEAAQPGTTRPRSST